VRRSFLAECPKTHQEEVAAIFPGIDIQGTIDICNLSFQNVLIIGSSNVLCPIVGMLVIPTCQKSNVNLVEWGESADVEKDRLLERVRNFKLNDLTSTLELHLCIDTVY